MKFLSKWKTIAISLLCVVSLGGIIGGSIAWFNSYVTMPDERIEGSIRGAYFAYGNGKPRSEGSEDCPYGIETPRQLYNLAWLQYSGYFNRDLDNDKKFDTFYFELSDKVASSGLDMTGYVLPPIGTETYPFLGEFNGKGKIVKNLTVSNQFSDYGTKRPTTVSESNYRQPQIVGFFGVIGSLPDPTYTYSSATNKFYDTGLVNVNVKTVTASSLIGVAAGYVNADISGVAVDASEVNIDAGTSKALETYTSNLSDHGVIGHVAKEGRKKEITQVNETIYELDISSVHEFSASDQGDTQGFGGSIDMASLYNNICTKVWEVVTNDTKDRSDDTHIATYPTTATQSISKEGVEGEVVFNASPTSSSTGTSGFQINGDEKGYFTSNQTKYRTYYNYDFADGGHKTASFGMIVETGASTWSTEKRYMCLSGERDITATDGATLTTNYYDSFSGSFVYYEDSQGTKNYLSFNGSGSSPQNVTATSDDDSKAFRWKYAGNQFTTKILSTNTTYYLNCNSSGVLTVTTTNNTTWNKDSLGYYATVNSIKHYLGFNGANWVTTTYHDATPATEYWTIYNGTSYMTHKESPTQSDNNYVTVTNSPSSNPYPNTVRWYLVDDGKYFSATPSEPYFYIYLYTYSTWTNYNSNVAEGVRYRYSGTTNEGDNSGHLSVTYNNKTYYPYLSDDYWDPSSSYGGTYQETTLTFRKTSTPATEAGYDSEIHAASITLSTEGTAYSKQKSRTSTIDSKVHTNPTYLPLSNKKTTVGNTTTTTFGVPDEYNTGYIVSGAKYRGDPYGDIRVSQFGLTGSSGSLSGSGFTQSTGKIGTYYTINDSGTQVQINKNSASDTFKSSSSYLEDKVLKGQSYVYGLHFMDAEISHGSVSDASQQIYKTHNVGQSVQVPKAVINKETHYDYELPTDCIDFNLKEKGYINFIAGTYYQANTNDNTTRNNSFFSLYEIVRNSDQSIKELRKISEVLTDESIPNSYQYKYDKKYTDSLGVEGQYSVPFKYSNGNKVKLDSTTDNPKPYTDQSVQASKQSGYSTEFKTSWIEGRSYSSFVFKAAYYFEIPMNEGEYCLGSVSGYNGAYLMYLDIGANASKTQRTVVSEHFYIEEKTMEYPLGIAIVSSPSDLTSEIKTKNNEHNYLACAEIAEGFTGTLSFAVNSKDSSQIDIIYVGEKAVPIFQGENIKMNIAEKLKPKETTTKDIKRIEYYDYTVNTQETTKVIIDFVSTNGGAYQRTIKCFDASGAEITDQSKWKIFRTATGIKFSSENDFGDIKYTNLTKTTGDGLFYSNNSDTALLSIRYWETETITGETAYVLNLTQYRVEDQQKEDFGKITFSFQNYTLQVTASGGSLKITVLSVGSRTIIIGTTTVTSVGQTITINAS